MKTSSFFCTIWMKIKHQPPLIVWLLCLGIGFYPSSVTAQTVPTPTPDPANAVVIVVQSNDSLWSIAATAGISLDQLLTLNGLTETAVIQPGQQIIVGYAEPEPTATATEAAPTITPTHPPPPPTETAVPPPPTGVCLLAFDDANANGIYDVGESLKTAVAFTLFNEDAVIVNYVTDGVSEPYCLADLAEGTYQVTRSIGTNETLTTPGDRGIVVQLGEMVDLTFGSYQFDTLQGNVNTESTTVAIVGIDGETVDYKENEEATAVAFPPTQSTLPFQRPLIIGTTILLLLLLSTIFFIIRWQRNYGRMKDEG